jgi:hypothetical protein
MEAVRVFVHLILGIALTYFVHRWDSKRLTDEQRAHAWNSATLGQALINFGPWSMLGWGWVTRRGRGLLLGFAAAVLISVVLAVVDLGFVAVFGEE